MIEVPVTADRWNKFGHSFIENISQQDLWLRNLRVSLKLFNTFSLELLCINNHS